MKTVRFLFNDAMARAIVEGRKTVTRRPVMCPGWNPAGPEYTGETMIRTNSDPRIGTQAYFRTHESEWHGVRPPCLPGDLLIGRECWQYAHPEYHSEAEGVRRGKPMSPDGKWCWYRADDDGMESGDHEDGRPRWRTSIHMPDWAARIRRRVVSVSVERLQDITNKEAIAEGIEYDVSKPNGWPIDRFMAAWDSIYSAKGLGWDVNPWVWRIEFSAEDVAQDVAP